jgi:hypothetical protein
MRVKTGDNRKMGIAIITFAIGIVIGVVGVVFTTIRANRKK